MSVLHVQQQRFSPLGQGLLIGGVVLCMLLAFFVAGPWARALALGVGALLFLAWLNFERLTVAVTDQELCVGYPVLRSRVPLASIRQAESIGQLRPWRHGGLGVRLWHDQSFHLGYLARTGPALRIRAEGRRSLLVFTCDRPEEVLAALQQAGVQALEGEKP